MAYDTKVTLQSVLNQIALAKDLEQLYKMIASMAMVEGLKVPSYSEMKAELGVENKEKK